MTIPDSVTSIDSSAFYICSSLTHVELPASITYIANTAFSRCTGLTQVTLNNNYCVSRFRSVFPYSQIKSIILGSSVTSIGNSDFKGCTQIESLAYNGTTEPSNNGAAFNDCSKLTEVKVPTNYSGKSFCGKPFYCTGKCGTNVSWEFHSKDSTLTIRGTGSLADYSSVFSPWYSFRSLIKSVTIENGVTSIEKNIFSGCTNLKFITVPETVISIEKNAFESCINLTEINISENNTKYKSIDGVLYSKDEKILIQCPGGKDGNVIIPETVTSIEDSAFKGCARLRVVTIPKSVNLINSYAFFGCTSLTSVTYKGMSDPGVLSTNVFYNCPLTEVNVPSSYTDATFCGYLLPTPSMSPMPTPSMSPTPSPSMSPTPSPSMSPTPSPSMSPTPSLSMSPTPSPSMSVLPTPIKTSIQTNSLNGENNSKNNKTALIATIVSVAATVVVTAAIAIACYFKNPSSFPCFRTSDETVEV